ncbi:hypothetical protein C3L33_22978, partial [Rhododendron williamsianum]
MAGGGGRSLEQTPTWAVAVVCFVLVAVSIVIEYIIHLIGKWLKRKHKRALYEALEKGHVPFVSSDGIHQLHIFIFVLAVFHVIYCILTMVLGRLKVDEKLEGMGKGNENSRVPVLTRFASSGNSHIWHLKAIQGLISRNISIDHWKRISRWSSVSGWYSYYWLPFIPLIIILLVGTKLQVIISKMAIRIQQRGEVVKGVPVVQPGDDLFWFNRPRLILYLINFVLFQMGSTMKPTIFNEKVATALRNWHHTAKKHIKQNRQSGFTTTPMSSRPATPSHHLSPVHLLRHYRSEIDSSVQNTPRRSNFDVDHWGADTDGSPSPSHRHHRYGGGRGDGDGDGSSSHRHQQIEMGRMEDIESREVPQLEPSSSRVAPLPQHEIDIGVPKDFSFDKRTST